MKICLICEGCYPYVVGGVSSWVQQLVKNFPDLEFVLYTIGADSSQKGKFLYELPPNLTEVKEVFLNDVTISRGKERDRQHRENFAAKWEIDEIRKLMLANPDKWSMIFDFFQYGEYVISDFLLSRDFYDIVYEVYFKGYGTTIFVDFLWTMRSMYMTLFHVLNNPPPKADLYHSVSTGYAGIAGALGKHLYGGSYVITEHGIYTREREEEIITAAWVNDDFKSLWINYFKSLSIGAYEAADRIISLFNTNRQIEIDLGADPLKCDVISNGINYELYDALPGKSEEEVESGNINVGAVIRVSPIKDIKTMLYAFDLVKRKLPNAHFYLMGPTDEIPEYYQECTALVKELGLLDLEFTGRVNIREYIGRMDVIVLSSLSEAQPLALMEAMAAGLPCVSTNVGCCKELFNGKKGDRLGVAGLLAPIMGYEQIADNIIRIVRDENLKKSMGEAGRNRIVKDYSEKKFRDAYRQLYKEFDKIKG